MDVSMAVRSVCRSAGSMVAPMEHSMAALLVLRWVVLTAYCSADQMDDSMAGLMAARSDDCLVDLSAAWSAGPLDIH